MRRILAQHFPRPSESDGPSWLTLIGDTADSLWSVNLFRCESIVLKSYWVLVVMDLRGGRGFSDTGVSGNLPEQYSNRRTQIHEETKT